MSLINFYNKLTVTMCLINFYNKLTVTLYVFI